VERPQTAGTVATVETLHLDTGENVAEFSFLKHDGAGGNVRRRGYRFDANQIQQLRWPGSDALSKPDSYLMLDRVASMRCSVMDKDGVRRTIWPDKQAGAAIAAVAMDIELELPDVGTIRRLIALR
jgi:hypothetical protein